MISRLHPDFRRGFARLPPDIRVRAREAYKRFASNPSHPGLRFKRITAELPIWSVRISDSYRAVGIRTQVDTIVWFFIGTHAEYDGLLKTLR